MPSISIKADRTFALAVKAFAESKGEKVGDVVREAVIKYCGSELDPFLEFFSERTEANYPQYAVKPHILTVKGPSNKKAVSK